MELQAIKDFFNHYALSWDDDMVIDENIIKTILDDVGVKENSRVLDVACGTGVLIPFYLNRNIKEVVGVDLSNKMIDMAQSKFNNDNVKFICDDVFNLEYKDYFDQIVIYNALPHFLDEDALIKHLSLMLKSGGRLIIAHGASREKINKHHSGVASPISKMLISGDKLKGVMSRYLKVLKVIDDDLMYEVCGEKK